MTFDSLASRTLCAALAAALAGCATIAPDRGFGDVARQAQERSGATPRLAQTDDARREIAAAIAKLLRQPLSVDDAVRIAVVNHPGLQASYWEVGIAQADLVQASRLPNPALDFKRVNAAGAIGIERTFTVGLVGALTTPLAAHLESRRFQQAKLAVGAAIERHIAATRRAWYEAVAAEQGVEYASQVEQAAGAAAELSARMVDAGNASKLDMSREQAFHADAGAALARAERDARACREKLARLLGLSSSQFQLPGHLPELPSTIAALADVEGMALAQRLDVQAAKADAEATAANLGLTRATRFVNVFDLGYVRNTGAGEPSGRGYDITLEVPLFDWGGAKVARSEAVYMQSLNRLAQAAVDARSEAREAYADYQASYVLARRYRDEVIPLRKKISQEVLLRYNGMLASTFELLADAREQANAVNATIDAQKEFWIAHATLEAALGTRVAINKGSAQ